MITFDGCMIFHPAGFVSTVIIVLAGKSRPDNNAYFFFHVHFTHTTAHVSQSSHGDYFSIKVHFLRTMLQWEEQILLGASSRERKHQSSLYGGSNSVGLGEVVVIRWPHGEIMRMKSGSTAADAARRIGQDGKLVWVNGQLVLPQTQLKDGDIIEVRV